jgi:hypothetical protein
VEEFHEGDRQVDGENDEVTHGVHRIMTAGARKTAPNARIPSYYEFAPNKVEPSVVGRDSVAS